MRQLTTLATRDAAGRLADYLTAQGINAHVEEDGDDYAIWVREDDHLEPARKELGRFRQDPDHERYQAAGREAQRVRLEEAKRRRQIARNLRDTSKTFGGARLKSTPVTFGIILVCVVVSLITNFGDRWDPRATVSNWTFTFADFEHAIRSDADNAPLPPDRWGAIVQGEVWRLVTPSVLHYGPIHLLFNMYFLWMFGRQIEQQLGSWYFLGLVCFLSPLGNIVTVYGDGPRAAGFSGVGYGIFGFLWMRAAYDRQRPWVISQQTIALLIGWFFLGIAMDFIEPLQQFMGFRMANWGHGSGLLLGMLAGFTTAKWPPWRRSFWRL